MAAPSTGLFDAHHPPSPDLAADCVHCGFCLPACPTYALWGKETHSPRGRIHLVAQGLRDGAELSDGFVRPFDTCLGCMACLTACPSGVQYDQLLGAVRPQIERRWSRSFADRWFRRAVLGLFPYPSRLRWTAAALWAYRALGVAWLVRAIGLLGLLPARLGALEAMAPPVTLASAWGREITDRVPRGTPRRRVGLLLGCVQRVFFDEVNQATARVLVAEGCEVVVPPGQGCCGALPMHAGAEAQAETLARQTIDAFTEVEVDTIAINAAGCGSAVKEYGHLLRDDPVYADRARAFAAKCRDISEILDELEPQAPRHPLPLRVAYHDACHLQHAQRVTAPPRTVLGTIPELQLREIADGGMCCGSAGLYNLVEPETARQLGARKARHVGATEADLLVSGNPGCLIQLGAALTDSGRPLPTRHLIEVVDASIRGLGIEALLSGETTTARRAPDQD